MNHFSRRRFIKASTLIGVAATGINLDLIAKNKKEERFPKTEKDWYNKPMRWANLTLVETDPPVYDPQYWLNFYKKAHVDALCLSVGGYVAYYNTKVPFHHRSEWLNEKEDTIGDLIAGCRKLKIMVTARIDPHAVRKDLVDAHPEWISVDMKGNLRKHWEMADRWLPCPYGNYSFEYVPLILKEIMSRYRVDGIFANRWNGTGMCYCEFCKRSFKNAYGLDLPKASSSEAEASIDSKDPSSKKYSLSRSKRLFEL